MVSVVTAIDGATLLMLNGYAFIDPSPMPNGERWYCSGRLRWGCSVCLHVNDDYELVCISNEHTHKPPVYEKTPGGMFSKMYNVHGCYPNPMVKQEFDRATAAYIHQREKANARKQRFLDKMTESQKELKKAKDREYYHNRKRQRKSIAEMTALERSLQREIWKRNAKKYREKKNTVD